MGSVGYPVCVRVNSQGILVSAAPIWIILSSISLSWSPQLYGRAVVNHCRDTPLNQSHVSHQSFQKHRGLMSKQELEKVTHAFICSRIALTLTTAACSKCRVLAKTEKCEYITPILKSLYWLKGSQRPDLKYSNLLTNHLQGWDQKKPFNHPDPTVHTKHRRLHLAATLKYLE